MMIIADTHVHFYPCYNAPRALHGLIANLHKLDPSADKAAFLTERQECCFFTDLRDRRIDLPAEITVEPTSEKDALLITENQDKSIYLLAGRQVATKERLEILTLTSDTIIEDGLPAREVIDRALENGSVPVLTWALGKWSGRRRTIVREIIKSYKADELLVGDSSMRPSFFPQPSAIKEALERGTSVIAGSDPLPFEGDEQYMGTYATLIEGALDKSAPVTSIRKTLLTSPNSAFTLVGSRCGPISVITRQLKL